MKPNHDLGVGDSDVLEELQDVKTELYNVYNSTSWRLTKPLRKLKTYCNSLLYGCSYAINITRWILNPRRIIIAIKLLWVLGFSAFLRELKYSKDRTVGKLSYTPVGDEVEYVFAEPLTKDQVLISVVIPCFNYGKFVVQAINSVLDQTIANSVEIIVVDGGSTDAETIETIRSIHGDNIKVYERSGRHFVGSNRNYGIERAAGRYICCLDADDTIDPTYLEKSLFYLETYKYDIVSTSINFIGHKSGVLDVLEMPDLSDMVNSNHILTCGVFRRKLWEDSNGYFDFGIGKDHVAEDWDFWIRLVASGARIRNIPEYLFNYRIHKDGSLSSSADVMQLSAQKRKLLKSNKHLLTKYSFKFSQTQKQRKYKADSMTTALAKCVRENNKKFKHTILISLPYFMLGGAERLLSDFCEYLSGSGWRVIVISTLKQDCKFGNVEEWFKKYTTEVYCLRNFLQAHEVHDFITYLLATREIDIVLNAGSKVVYDMLPTLSSFSKKIVVADLLFNTFGHTASHLKYSRHIDIGLAENDQVCDWYSKIALRGSDTIFKIQSGVDLDKFKPSSRSKMLVQKYSLELNDIVIGYSGRLSEEKSPEIFVAVANRFKELKNIHFIMTGGGPLGLEISKMVNKQDANRNLIYCGIVDNVIEFLQLYDLLVLPSKIDGRPLVVMEALAAGVPVIASDVGGLKDLIIDGYNGYLVTPGSVSEIEEKILYVLNNVDVLNGLKRGARTFAEQNLDKNKSYSKFERVLSSIISNGENVV